MPTIEERQFEYKKHIEYLQRKIDTYQKNLNKKRSEINYRKCNNCNLSQRWCDWFGWEFYVPIKQRIIEEKLIKDFLEKINKIKNEQ